MENITPQLANVLLDAAPVGMATVDAHGKMTWCNPALAALAGKSAAELIGSNEGEVLEFTQGDTGNVHFPATGRIARRTTCNSDQLAIFYVDITDATQLAKQLQAQDTIEPVSGLLNSQAIASNLDPLVSRSRRYDNPLTVVTMAITNAAAAADSQQVIVAVSQLLRDQLRWADMIGRNDDGNFIFVLPETDRDAAVALANKIAGQLGGLAIGSAFQPQASFGVAQWIRGDDTGLLLKRSAEALNSAMQKGDLAVAV